MGDRKTFLDTLQITIRKLQEEGIITQEELKEKIDIPIEWLYSKGIDRNVIVRTMNNLCAMKNPAYKRNLKNNITINYIRICERNKKIIIEVPGEDGWIYFGLADDISYHKNRKVSYFSSEEFVQEVYKTMTTKDEEQFKQDMKKLSVEELQNRMKSIYSLAQKQEKLDEISKSLSEMMENLGHYYEKMYERKRALLDLNPEQIISLSLNVGKKEEKIEKYIGYIFKNRRENSGYFVIIAPENESKSTRAIYLTDQTIERLQSGVKNSSNFWEIFATLHAEMSERDFADRSKTKIIDQTRLDEYSATMKYIIKGEIDITVSPQIIYRAKMSLTKLFGNNVELTRMMENIPEDEIQQARKIITPRTKNKDVGGIEQ